MKLQEVRKQRNITQAELAAQSGVKLRTIQEYEYGRRKIDNARIDTLVVIADVLRVPFYDIIDDEDLVKQIKANLKKEI